MANLPTLPCLMSDDNSTLSECIEGYFKCSFTYLEIQEFLHSKHGINTSLSTIKRYLRKLNLFRRPLVNRRTSVHILENAVQEELRGSGSGIGYRRVWAHLRSRGIISRREDIRKIILNLDPLGVDLRRRRRLRRRRYSNPGPNYVWHLDGHDKLKPFGFSIHGCIDGYSRRLIWLEVAATNKMPDLIAKYYLDAVKQLKGIPKTLKADDGTENSMIQPIHVCLREPTSGINAVRSFSIISSPLNQRIESYWSKLRQDRPGWWKSFFQDMVDLELFNASDPVLLDCIRFCFMHLIRNELYSVANEWNQHLISKSINCGPSGRPDSMFFLPHLFHAEDHLQQVEFEELEEIYSTLSDNPVDYTDEFQEFAHLVMRRENMQLSIDAESGLNLYMFLKRKVEEYS